MKISFEAETLQELVEQLTIFVCHATRRVEAPSCDAEPVEAPTKPVAKAEPEAPAHVEQDEPVAEAEEAPAKPAKAARTAKAPAPIETLNPEAASPKEREKARLLAIGSIRAFVLADKSKNMKKLIGVMPDGKKSIDALTLEEAQKIVLDLGIE